MRFVTLLLVLVATLPAPAFAHTGIGPHFAFVNGFTHPLLGLDHLLTMVGVGLWAALAGGKARWLWPIAFVAVMSVGGALALNGIVLPNVEALILASVIVVGVAVAFGLRLPLVAGAAVCAVFALAHGHAHGAELPAGASAIGYVAGFVVATSALHATGIYAGLGLQRSSLLTRLTGAAIATIGAMLAFA